VVDPKHQVLRINHDRRGRAPYDADLSFLHTTRLDHARTSDGSACVRVNNRQVGGLAHLTRGPDHADVMAVISSHLVTSDRRHHRRALLGGCGAVPAVRG
jgi:hypothetical protein